MICRVVIAVAFALCLGISQEGGSGEKILTLREAIERGLKNNFSVRLVKTQTEKAGNNILLGTGGFLPRAEVTGSLDIQDADNSAVPPGASQTTSQSAAANLNWTLFDGFKMFYLNAAYDERLELARAAERDAVEKAVLDIVDAYYDLWIQRELLDLDRDQLKISEDRLSRTRDKYQTGAAGRSALLQSEVDRNADASSVYQNELQAMRAGTDLKILIAAAPGDSLRPSEMALPQMLDGPEIWLAAALENNAGLSMAKRESVIAYLEQKISRSAFWPEITASASYQLSRSELSFGGTSTTSDSRNTQAGLSARWPLFNGFRNVTAAKNATLDRRSAQLREEEVDLRLRLLVGDQWFAMTKAYERIEFDKKTLELAEENFKIFLEKRQLGGVGDLEFREAQLGLKRAKAQSLITKYQAVQSVYRLRHMAGKVAF